MVLTRETASPVGKPALTLMATCLGLFIGQVDTSAVNLALPAIGRDLAGDIGTLQWVVDAYNVAFAAVLLGGGTLGDRFGRRRLFRTGVAVFVLASIAAAVAPTSGVLIAARAVQGIGSGLMLPQSLAILAVAFPGRAERNRAMAAWSMAAGVGLAAGPTIGGVLVDLAGWSVIFWVNVPIGLIALLLAVRHVPESRNPDAARLDVPGQVLAALFLAALTFVVVDGKDRGWLSPVVLGAAVLAVGCLLAFRFTERRQADPMLPPELVRNRGLLGAAVVAMCMTFGMFGLFMLVSIAFQNERGTTALTAGLLILPLAVVFTLLSPVAGRLVTRFGPRLPMTAGMTLMAAGLGGYALAGPDAGLGLIETAFVVVGIGLALNTGPVVGVAVSSVRPERAGLASGVANLARMFGATLGVAAQGTVLAVVGNGATHGPAFDSGLKAALLLGCAVETAGAVVAFRTVNRSR